MVIYHILFLFVCYLHGRRGSEPAGLCGLRKQVTEVEEGPVELRREEGKVCAGGKEGGKKACRQRVREGERD